MYKLCKKNLIDDDTVIRLAKKHNLENDVVSLLLTRGIQEEDFKSFLEPSLINLTPISFFKPLQDIALRINSAIENNEKIVVLGDYDCDGICASSILYLFLKSRNADVDYFLPNRRKDGYGLTISAIEKVAETFLPDLIVTVDCGISSHKEVEYCKDLGIDIVVTDHHEPSDILPDCLIFDAKIYEDFPFSEYCGAGVALRLVQILGGDIREYIDIAAIATVGDVVPLLGDNRIITHFGLKKLNEVYKRKGLSILFRKLKLEEAITSQDLAFKIVPKINAVGRLSDANEVVDLLVSDDDFVLDTLTDKIIETNTIRQEYTEETFEHCIQIIKKNNLLKNKILIVYSPIWHEGILGIVAARLAETFYRPTIVLTKCGDSIKGSGRSTDEINIFECVKNTSAFLFGFGGHASACGLSLSEDNLNRFCDAIQSYAEEKLSSELFYPKKHYDFELDEFPTMKSFGNISQFEPFGKGNEDINFLLSCKKCSFSSISNKEHIKFSANPDCQLVGFNRIRDLSFLNSETEKQFLLNFKVSNYKNKVYLNAYLKDVFPLGQFEKNVLCDEYIKQWQYDGKSVFNIEEVNFQNCIGLLKKAMYGTIFLCYTVSTYNEFVAKMPSDISLIKYINTVELNPLNCICLNAEGALDLETYENIVFLDNPICEASINYLKLNKDAKVYRFSDETKFEFKDIFCDYKTLGELFIAIKTVLSSNKNAVNAYDLCEKCRALGVYDSNKLYFAIMVFKDLEILKENENGQIYFDKIIVNKLDNSKLYNKFKIEVTSR